MMVLQSEVDLLTCIVRDRKRVFDHSLREVRALRLLFGDRFSTIGKWTIGL